MQEQVLAPKPLSKTSFLIERCTVDPMLNRVVSHDGNTTHLEPRIMQLLVYMSEHPEEVLSRETLLNAIWGDAFVCEQVLTNAISQIRQAFGEAGRDYLQTIPKRGYRLTARVTQELATEAPSTPVISDNEPARSIVKRHKTALQVAVIAALVVAMALSLYFAIPRKRAIRSVAVLPLQNLSNNQEQDHVVDGIHEELTSTLGRISKLQVTSRTSVTRYRNTEKPIPKIANELHVDAVLEGSVQCSGNRVAITLKLIDGKNDRQLWSKIYEREMTDVLRLENEITTEVAREVNAALTPTELSLLASAPSVDPEAYEAYLKGRYYTAQTSLEAVPKAVAEFETAIAKDPSFAAAYAGLADLYVQSPGRQVPGLNDRKAIELAEGAAKKALQLDPTSAEAHTAEGNVRLATSRPYTAEREFLRALQLNPNSADAEINYASVLLRLGRPQEAVVHAQRAIQLDPNSPSKNLEASGFFGYSGDRKRSKELFDKVLQLDPHFPMAHFQLAWAEAFSGQGKGKCDNDHLRLAGRNPERLAFLAYCYGKTGRLDEAKRKFHEMETDPNYPNMYPRMLAYAYIGLGEKDKAISVMQRAFDERTPWFDEILLGPCELDSDPRWEAIKKAVRADYEKDQRNAV